MTCALQIRSNKSLPQNVHTSCSSPSFSCTTPLVSHLASAWHREQTNRAAAGPGIDFVTLLSSAGFSGSEGRLASHEMTETFYARHLGHGRCGAAGAHCSGRRTSPGLDAASDALSKCVGGKHRQTCNDHWSPRGDCRRRDNGGFGSADALNLVTKGVFGRRLCEWQTSRNLRTVRDFTHRSTSRNLVTL
jgi:hypothetical protein